MVPAKKPVKIVAVDCNCDLNPQEVIETVRKVLAKEKGVVLVVFPENVLGEKAITRQQGKEIASRIGAMLRERKNAYVFVSFVEKGIDYKRRPVVVPTGYIVGPWTRKPYWSVYQKKWSKDRIPKTNLAHKRGAIKSDIQKSDKLILLKNSGLSPRQIVKLINVWGERAKRNAPFPVTRIAGREVQLRLCADIANQRNRYTHDERKVDFVVVPAHGLLDHVGATIAARDAHTKGLLIVDRVLGVSYHPKRGTQKRLINPEDVIRDKLHGITIKKVWPAKRTLRR